MPLSDEYFERVKRYPAHHKLAGLEHPSETLARARRKNRIRFVLQLAVVAFFSFVAGCVAGAAGWFGWR